MDFLKNVFQIQHDFTNKLFKEKYNISIESLTAEERKNWIKEYILSGGKEFYEMLDELPGWKKHTDVESNGTNFLEEGIDTFKFLINCLMLYGYTADDFAKKFEEKSIIVNFRYEQEKVFKTLTPKSKIVFFDIDGVVNYYPQEFLFFVQERSGITYKSIQEMKALNFKLYTEIKHEYRSSGKEASLSRVRKEIKEIIETLWTKGCTVVLLTARPYKKYNRLFFDTLQWLRENNVIYDLIYFEREKSKFVLDKFKDHSIYMFVDDDIENVNRVCKIAEHTILVKNQFTNDETDYLHVNQNVHITDSEDTLIKLSNDIKNIQIVK